MSVECPFFCLILADHFSVNTLNTKNYENLIAVAIESICIT